MTPVHGACHMYNAVEIDTNNDVKRIKASVERIRPIALYANPHNARTIDPNNARQKTERIRSARERMETGAERK